MTGGHGFTQKERDTDSGLNYFLAGYHSREQGRFTVGKNHVHNKGSRGQPLKVKKWEQTIKPDPWNDLGGGGPGFHF